MRKYGNVAISATAMVQTQNIPAPEAWEVAARTIFPNSVSLQHKGCPRGAYLGLCEDGLIRGIPPGSYTRSRDNKKYALRAIELLVADPTMASTDTKTLWTQVLNGQQKARNSQMDVVLALWQHGLIDHPVVPAKPSIAEEQPALHGFPGL